MAQLFTAKAPSGLLKRPVPTKGGTHAGVEYKWKEKTCRRTEMPAKM